MCPSTVSPTNIQNITNFIISLVLTTFGDLAQETRLCSLDHLLPKVCMIASRGRLSGVSVVVTNLLHSNV